MQTANCSLRCSCYDYSKWKSGAAGPVLKTFEPAVEEKISLEDCAQACQGDKKAKPGSVAGVLAGAHCFCGASSDLSSVAAKALSRPKSECIVSTTPCDGDKGEKECGGPGRMLAYAYTCDGAEDENEHELRTAEMKPEGAAFHNPSYSFGMRIDA